MRTLAPGLVKPLRFFICQVLILIIFYWPFLSGKASWFYEDITHFFEPLCSFIGRALRQGHLPLWNPYNYCGMPQAAISSPGIFYPPNWIFAVLDFDQALSVQMILAQAIAGLGIFLLTISFGWGELAAILAGLSVAFSGYMFSLSNNYTLVAGASWFPLLLWCANMMRSSGGRSLSCFTIGAAFSFSLMVSSGRPEIWLPGTLCYLIFIAYLVLSPTSLQRGASLVDYARTLILGGLLCLPSILPSLEWAPLSRRSDGLASAEVLMFSASWYDFLSIFVSQSLGDLQLRHSELRALVQPKNIGPYFSSAFLGSLVLALSVLGLQGAGRRLFWIACSGIVLFALLSFGANLPFADSLVVNVPGFSLLRFPSKLLFFCCVGLALLAARGVRNYLQDGFKNISADLVCLFFVVFGAGVLLSPDPVLPFLENESALKLAAQRMIGQGLLIWSAHASIFLLILRLLRRIKREREGAALACVLCLVSMLYNAFTYCRYEAPPQFYKTKSELAQILNLQDGINEGKGEAPRIAPFFMQKFTVPPAYDSTDRLQASIKAYQYSRQVLRPFANVDYHVPEVLGFEGAMVGEYFYLCLNTYARSSQYLPISPEDARQQAAPCDIPLARIAQLCAAPFLVTQSWRDISAQQKHQSIQVLDPALFDRVHDDEQLNLRVYKVKNVLPRAYLSYNWKKINTREDLISQIFNAEKSGWDPNRCTLIESSTEPSLCPEKPNESVKYVETVPELISMEAQPKDRCLLVIADQFYPGWKVTVDGVSQPILRVNGFMRGVFLEAGSHKIEFVYDPDSVKYALILCVVGLIWSAGLIIFQKSARSSE